MNHTLALTALLTVTLDLGIKLLPHAPDRVLLPGFLAWTFTQNTGAAFGMFSANPALTLAVSAGLTLALGWFLSKIHFTRFESTALGLMLGGAAGNIIDRALHGAVTDYLEFLFFRFPVFNLADAALTCGAALLMIYWFVLKKGGLT